MTRLSALAFGTSLIAHGAVAATNDLKIDVSPFMGKYADKLINKPGRDARARIASWREAQIGLTAGIGMTNIPQTVSPTCAGTQYYANQATGNDSNPGTLSQPWATPAKVVAGPAGKYPAGACINLAGGQTWSYCTTTNLGGSSHNAVLPFTVGVNVNASSSSEPITLKSYGTGGATVSPTSGCTGLDSSVVYFDGVDFQMTGITVVVPSGTQNQWALFVVNYSGGIDYFLASDNDISGANSGSISGGFGGNVYVNGTFNSPEIIGQVNDNTLHGLTLTGITDVGLLTKGQDSVSGSSVTSNVHVTAQGNDIYWIGGHAGAPGGVSGNGILFSATTNSTQKSNRNSNNGANVNSCGGGANTWAYESEAILIVHNEGYNNEPASTLQGYISGTTLTVTSVPAVPSGQSAVLAIGSNIKQALPGTAITDAIITGFVSGTLGGVGVYTISVAQTVGSSGSHATIGFAPYYTASSCDFSNANFDGSVYQSIMAYNLSWHNFGQGFTTCMGCDTNTWGPNWIYENVSVGDAVGPYGNGSMSIWNKGANPSVLYAYQNTLIQNNPVTGSRGTLWGNPAYSVIAAGGTGNPTSGTVLADNILVIAPGDSYVGCDAYGGTVNLATLTWKSNLYFGLGGAAFAAGNGIGGPACAQSATSFAAWESAIGETGGLNTDPQFFATPTYTGTPYLGPAPWVPSLGQGPQPYPQAMQLLSGSPALGGGVSVASLVGGSMSPTDYYDNDVNPNYSIGAYGGPGTGQPSFYQSTTGNDSNPGTLGAPFLTFGKSLSAMIASGTVKNTFVLSGTYNINASIDIESSAGANGVSFQAYPGDTPVINGGGTVEKAFTLGASSSASDITISGFTFEGVQSGIDVQATTNLTAANNIFNGLTSPDTNHAGIYLHYQLSGTILLSHNACSNMNGPCLGFGTGDSDPGVAGATIIYDSNKANGTCTGISDCGAWYWDDRSHTLANGQNTNNVAFNYGQSSSAGICVYLDDDTSHVLVQGNACDGQGQYPILIHGGDHNNITNNVFILTSAFKLALYQDDGSHSVGGGGMAGNQYSKNIVYSAATPPAQLWDCIDQTILTIAMPALANDLYYDSVSPFPAYGSSGGGGTCSSVGVAETNPTVGNPLFVNLATQNYTLQSGSPALASPVNFVQLRTNQGPQ